MNGSNKIKSTFKEIMKDYKKDIVLFAREVLNFESDEWQKKAFYDIARHNRISIKSGHGVGKTSVEAITLLWFLSCFPFARVIATAPTMQQIHDILWSEAAKWLSRSPLLSSILSWTKTYIYMIGYEKRWFALARASTNPENMQGFHEDNMLYIVDEASGVGDPIIEAILGALSGENNKLLMCGNPTKTTGEFYKSHTVDRALYKCHTVSALNSPRTNKENIQTLIKKYGADSNFARVRIYGEFPVSEDDVFIPLPLIEHSVNLGRDYVLPENPTSIHLACDVARFGSDFTIIGSKIDEKVEFPHKFHGQDTMKTADKIIELGETLKQRYKWTGKIPVKIDDGGVGGGVIDRLRQLKRNNPEKLAWLEIFPVNFGTRIQNKYYHDSTSFMTGVVKRLLTPTNETGTEKPVELILPDDDNLIAQLSTRKYDLTDASKIQIESKEAMKKRGLSSPDEADCLLLLCLPVKVK